MKHYRVAGQSVLPYDDLQSRAAYHFIATGEMLSASWYRQFEIPEENVDIAGHIQTINQQSDHGNTDQADVDMEENDDYGPLEESMVTNPEDTKLSLNSSLIWKTWKTNFLLCA